ncbi:hypothetical protein [Tropicibacter oceani]|uniref:Transferrin-binding protein B C-lobe/N-lobe beta barrel domain-containing protein n=1 Tax=Tropicibacter oceani TaxID=3058420 RepID=A0ABY8QLC7_9RHOB|nr:hypothetical protein [Tropicibacter oceani]WGW05434.1 hypothetical protein QF118_07770 [Tropicibacter oceani]
MNRIILALALASVLAACTGGNPNDSGNDDGIGTGTQPLVDEEVPDNVDEEGSTDNSGPDVYGTEANDLLTMNDVEFDTATGELVLNNMPFDGDDNLYARDATVSTSFRNAGSSFDAYRNVGGSNRYYAVFRQTDSGYSRVTAAGTDNYVTFGFGGVAAQRLKGNGALPNADQSYIFDGEYAAVRTIIDPDTGSEMQYVAGTVRIRVDVEDFDTTGAVEGYIADRTFFDNNGVLIDDLNGTGEFITLSTAEINFDNWTIGSSDASVVGGPQPTTDPNNLGGLGGGTTTVAGTWEGLFAGPNGEEVAGIVVMEGSGAIGIDETTGDYVFVQVREVGGFVAER